MTIAIKTPGSKIDALAIENVEREFSRRLPDDYKQFLLEFNGGKPETNEFDVPATKTGSGVNFVYGILATGRDGDLVHEQRLLKDRLPSGVIAIADAEGGNRVCLSLRNEDFGTVFFWDHELESEEDKAAGLAQVAVSFDGFFAQLRKFDPQNVQLQPGQVKHAWINPEFLKNLKK
jgi:hypothetical protein